MRRNLWNKKKKTICGTMSCRLMHMGTLLSIQECTAYVGLEINLLVVMDEHVTKCGSLVCCL